MARHLGPRSVLGAGIQRYEKGHGVHSLVFRSELMNVFNVLSEVTEGSIVVLLFTATSPALRSAQRVGDSLIIAVRSSHVFGFIGSFGQLVVKSTSPSWV